MLIKNHRKVVQTALFIAICLSWGAVCNAAVSAVRPQKITIIASPAAGVRTRYGIGKLSAGLKAEGYTVNTLYQDNIGHSGAVIVVGLLDSKPVRQSYEAWHIRSGKTPGKEGFFIHTANGNVVIAGGDESGALYGCLELDDELRAEHALPKQIDTTDQPQMVLRGTCIGLQKSTLLPGRGTYEYPYTPQNFPWFYNKALWLQYLDQMAENRYNALFLWNGHPFASLVKVKDYPYALEVDEATYQKNVDMYNFITREANRRGIWIIQGFYNIIVSKPFAEHNHLKTQDRNRHIIPIIADYTRKSIAAFVEKYPNVGLMLTLGEAMQGVGQDDIDWFTKTIIPGVKDGLKALGRTDEPPIVLRAHDTDAPEDMKYAKPLYNNLYTMAKYNGEALTTYRPHGPWAQLHRTLSSLGTVQIENVHIMANLEPFRYGADDFIQKCVQAMHKAYGSNGLHLYPQASYWDWPYTADKTNPRLLEMNRDWIWYKEWARYAWNCDRNRQDEVTYWSGLLAAKYGCSKPVGQEILHAYEQSGEIAPQILRRFGITDGNRQTMTLGMTMSELVDPEKYGLFSLLYNSEGPVGEMMSEYAEKEWKHEPHVGETPVDVINDIIREGRLAEAAIDSAGPGVTKDRAEFERLKNDMYCYNALANSYAHKVWAALWVLRYRYSGQLSDLEKALPELQISLEDYRQLVSRTKNTYLYANSMQTGARKIPVSGKGGKNKTWAQLLPYYQRELDNFKRNLQSLQMHGATAGEPEETKLTGTAVTLEGGEKYYPLSAGSKVFTDSAWVVKAVAPQLAGLQAVQLAAGEQITNGTTLKFSCDEPVKVLVGYFTAKGHEYLPEPQLETDASANDYGQADVKIADAIAVGGMPPVNVHTFSFGAGENTLMLGRGMCLVLGFVNGKTTIPVYDAGLGAQTGVKDLRWLFN